MSRKPFTGGELNELNGKMGISAPQNSVPVMRLIRVHKPKSTSELEQLIADHSQGSCNCGIRSQGSIQDFGRNLYNAQMDYWGECKYTLKDCIQWEYDLFIIQTLKGNIMESKCEKELEEILGSSYSIKESGQFIDEENRVDLEIFCNGTLIAGIQVKPDSFLKTRESVINFNKYANESYGKPVFYIYYNYDTEKFLNIIDIVDNLKKIN